MSPMAPPSEGWSWMRLGCATRQLHGPSTCCPCHALLQLPLQYAADCESQPSSGHRGAYTVKIASQLLFCMSHTSQHTRQIAYTSASPSPDPLPPDLPLPLPRPRPLPRVGENRAYGEYPPPPLQHTHMSASCTVQDSAVENIE